MEKTIVTVLALLLGGGAVGGGCPEIGGVFPILMTPYLEDGSVDYGTLAREAEFVAGCGADGVIWPAALDALGHLDAEEERIGLSEIAKALDGKDVWFVPCCPGTNTADAIRRVGVAEEIARSRPKLSVAMLIRMADDCRDDAQVRIHFDAVARVARHPVIIQTFAPGCPLPKMETLIGLAHDHPDVYGWYKVEGCSKDIADCMAELNAAKPTVKNVLNGWGGRDMFYHFRRFGSRGVITQRPSYADLIVKTYRALERDPDSAEARDLFLKMLFLRNLDDVLPENEMRGWHLYALMRRGIFKNMLSRTCKREGRWQLGETVLTAVQRAEADMRMRACGLW